MRTKTHTRTLLLLALPALAGGLSLTASGCCRRPPPAAPAPGPGLRASGRGGCPCARGMMRGKMARMMRGARMMRHKKLAAPKLLCARLLARHAKLLGLSTDQVTRLETLHKAHHAAMGEFRLATKRIFVALRAEWLKDQPDAGQIRKLAGELAALMQKKIAAKADYLLKAQGVLTPEQYKKLITLPPKGRHGMGAPGAKGRPCDRHRHPKGKPCRDCVS